MSFDPALIQQVRDAVPMRDVVAARVDLKPEGPLLVGRCPFHRERTGSFKVDPRQNRARCYGCDWAGDALQFLQDSEGLDFVGALRRLAALAGIALPDGDRGRPLSAAERAEQQRQRDADAAARAAAQARADAQETERALAIWRPGIPARGTLVEVYLRSRGITVMPAVLRFAARLDYWDGSPPARIASPPAMLAPFVDGEGRITGVHITWLRVSGQGKASDQLPGPSKKMRGVCWRRVIPLAPRDQRFGRLGIAEGIETALSLAAAGAAAGDDRPWWAAGSLPNLAGSGLGPGAEHPEKCREDGTKLRLPAERPHPDMPGWLPPAGTRDLIIARDADGKDPLYGDALIARAARRFGDLGIAVRIASPVPGADFNDMLRGAA